MALTVANTTHALEAGDLPHLFEPLWRKDAARTDRDHVGLGLALVSAIAQRLDIDVHAESVLHDALRTIIIQRFFKRAVNLV